jgi:hypothetical protein
MFVLKTDKVSVDGQQKLSKGSLLLVFSNIPTGLKSHLTTFTRKSHTAPSSNNSNKVILDLIDESWIVRIRLTDFLL